MPDKIYDDDIDDIDESAQDEGEGDEDEEGEDEDEDEDSENSGEIDPKLLRSVLPTNLYSQCASLLEHDGRGVKQLKKNLAALTFHLRLVSRFQHKATQHDLGAKKIVALLQERFNPLPKKSLPQMAIAEFLDRLPRRILDDIARVKAIPAPADKDMLINNIARTWAYDPTAATSTTP